LRSYWQQGGLRGTAPDQAFYVKVDAGTTSNSDIQNGRVNIEIGVAIEYPAEFIVIKLGQITGNATV
jgi:phage tail sheath protein FI